MNVNRLVGEDGRPAFPEGGLITQASRAPRAMGRATRCAKWARATIPSPETAVFAFAARAEKGILADLRIAFAGEIALRSQSLESSMIGRALPLSPREAATRSPRATGRWRSVLPEGLALQFGALVDGALGLLSR